MTFNDAKTSDETLTEPSSPCGHREIQAKESRDAEEYRSIRLHLAASDTGPTCLEQVGPDFKIRIETRAQDSAWCIECDVYASTKLWGDARCSVLDQNRTISGCREVAL
jgi:hypothetical protein